MLRELKFAEVILEKPLTGRPPLAVSHKGKNSAEPHQAGNRAYKEYGSTETLPLSQHTENDPVARAGSNRSVSQTFS
jgi:hypothetical protein